MGFGGFIDGGAKYRIATPATPYAWENLLFNDSYVVNVSQTGQGRSVCRKPRSKDAFSGSRFFYVVDGEDTAWCPVGRPALASLDSFECVHALSSTQWMASRNGLSVKISVCVPADGDHEIWTHTLTNTSTQSKRVNYFIVHAFAHPGLYLQETACVDGIICCRSNPFRSPYEANDNPIPGKDIAYLFSSRPHDSYECGETAFFGSDDLMGIPLAVKNGGCQNTPSHVQPPLGAFHYAACLAPGESIQFHVVGGTAQSVEQIVGLRARANMSGRLNSEIAIAEKHWSDVAGAFTIATPDTDLNTLVNFWLKKQATFMARNDRGHTITPVRNLLQDAMGYSLLDPEYAVRRMLDYAAWQQQDGFLWQWQALDGSSSEACLRKYKDAPFWLVSCVAFALDQLPDASILDTAIPFKDCTQKATLYEHLLRAVDYLARETGPHGLCLMGDGDWFDPLNGPGRGGKGESTWLTMAARFAIQQMIPICQRRRDAANAQRLAKMDVRLGAAIQEHCWDGDRFVAGFDDAGRPFGCSADTEGGIYLNAQTWALISGCVSPERKERLLKTIANINTPFGPCITWPAYTAWNSQVGRISLKQPGTTENGSVYCHGSMFAAFAYCLEGLGQQAYDVIRRTLPTNPDNPPEVNGQVPLYVPNFYFALPGSPDFGRSSRLYGTGTTAWLLWITVEHLLGIRATAQGLVVDPVIPPSWPRFAITRSYRGARYQVAVDNPQGVGRGVKCIRVNGQRLVGKLLPCAAGGWYDVHVELGVS